MGSLVGEEIKFEDKSNESVLYLNWDGEVTA